MGCPPWGFLNLAGAARKGHSKGGNQAGGGAAAPFASMPAPLGDSELPLRGYTHQSLAGATPGEIYFGFEPTCRSAVPPPRARDGDSANVVPFRIAHLDAGQRFPIIEKIAA
jgi:hypothetical protein